MGGDRGAAGRDEARNRAGKERRAGDFTLDTAQAEPDKVEAEIERAFSDKAGPQLEEQKPVAFEVLKSKKYPEGLKPVLEEDVLVGSSQVDLKLVDYIGGVKFTLDNLDEPQSLSHLRERIRTTRLGPESGVGQYRKFDVFGLEKADDGDGSEGSALYKSVVVAVVDPAYEHRPSIAHAR